MLTGQTSLSSELAPQLVILLSLICVVTELACYILFFRQVYYHNKGMLSRNIPTQGEVKRRRRVNAITFLGQFYGFIVECVLYFGVMFTLQESSDITYRAGIVLIFWLEFGVVSVVEVITSKNLRNFLPHNLCLD